MKQCNIGEQHLQNFGGKLEHLSAHPIRGFGPAHLCTRWSLTLVRLSQTSKGCRQMWQLFCVTGVTLFWHSHWHNMGTVSATCLHVLDPCILFLIHFYFYNTLSFSKILLLENLGGPERTKIFGVGEGSLSFTMDASCQLDIFGHDGDSLCMDGTQVGIFKESHQVGFRCFL